MTTPFELTTIETMKMTTTKSRALSSSTFKMAKGHFFELEKKRVRRRNAGGVFRASASVDFGFELARDMGVGAACYWISDELAQRVSETKAEEEGEETYTRDDRRRGRYVTFGSFDGLTSYLWYTLVDKVIPSPSGSSFSADAVSISALTASTTYDDELTGDLANAATPWLLRKASLRRI